MTWSSRKKFKIFVGCWCSCVQPMDNSQQNMRIMGGESGDVVCGENRMLVIMRSIQSFQHLVGFSDVSKPKEIQGVSEFSTYQQH